MAQLEVYHDAPYPSFDALMAVQAQGEIARTRIVRRAPPRTQSKSKSFERQLVRAWKTITCMVRKPQRTSVFPSDFDIIMVTNAAHRRSILMH